MSESGGACRLSVISTQSVTLYPSLDGEQLSPGDRIDAVPRTTATAAVNRSSTSRSRPGLMLLDGRTDPDARRISSQSPLSRVHTSYTLARIPPGQLLGVIRRITNTDLFCDSSAPVTNQRRAPTRCTQINKASLTIIAQVYAVSLEYSNAVARFSIYDTMEEFNLD